MVRKKWRLSRTDREAAAKISEKLNISPFASLILTARGCADEQSAADFIDESAAFSDPFEITDMAKACERIHNAIDSFEKICVYGDYDADGVTATALLSTFLESCGGNVITYIPRRDSEGYGLNNGAVDKLKSENVDLIITVDNGISAVNEAKYIKSLGMSLVITDHHCCGKVIPDACAVVDPQRDDLPFNKWAGVGVAFKLACALCGDDESIISEYADLVATGTVADIVELTGENRAIVKLGLEMINGNSRTGMNALRTACGSADKEYTAADLSFIIAPRLNAAGRLDDAALALEMLVTDDWDLAFARAKQLCELNTQRQEIVTSIVEDIVDKIHSNPSIAQGRVIIADGENYHKGVIGIAASRIVELFGKPCIVFSNDGEMCSGSCRSVEGFSVYDAVCACSSVLERFGGHPMAAGLGVKTENMCRFASLLQAYCAENYPVMPVPVLNIDCVVSPGALNLRLEEDVRSLEPFGCGNPQPVFAMKGLRLIGIAPMGGGRHLRLSMEKDGQCITAVMFGVTQQQILFDEGDVVDMAFKIARNCYKGVVSLSVQVIDLRSTDIKEDKYFEQLSVWNRLVMDECDNCSGEGLLPDRGQCAAVYRYLMKKKVYKKDFEALFFAMGGSVTYAQLKLCLKAFEQLGIIRRENGGIYVENTGEKVELMSAPVFLQIKSRFNYGK